MMLQQDDASTKSAIAELRRHIQTETNPAARQSLESAIAPARGAGPPPAPVTRAAAAPRRTSDAAMSPAATWRGR